MPRGVSCFIGSGRVLTFHEGEDEEYHKEEEVERETYSGKTREDRRSFPRRRACGGRT
jgi:hypothetical protein